MTFKVPTNGKVHFIAFPFLVVFGYFTFSTSNSDAGGNTNSARQTPQSDKIRVIYHEDFSQFRKGVTNSWNWESIDSVSSFSADCIFFIQRRRFVARGLEGPRNLTFIPFDVSKYVELTTEVLLDSRGSLDEHDYVEIAMNIDGTEYTKCISGVVNKRVIRLTTISGSELQLQLRICNDGYHELYAIEELRVLGKT